MGDPGVKGTFSNPHSKDRDDHDFYETPPGFTGALLDSVDFHHRIWEPAAGKGAISDVLVARGYDVLSSDIVKRREDVHEWDFFREDLERLDITRQRDIITNPPFKLLTEFLPRALDLCYQKFAMVMAANGLSSHKRYKAAWGWMPVSKVIWAGRYQHISSNRGIISSQFTHVWVVVDKGHEGLPTFEWTPDVVYKP